MRPVEPLTEQELATLSAYNYDLGVYSNVWDDGEKVQLPREQFRRLLATAQRANRQLDTKP